MRRAEEWGDGSVGMGRLLTLLQHSQQQGLLVKCLLPEGSRISPVLHHFLWVTLWQMPQPLLCRCCWATASLVSPANREISALHLQS